MCGLSGEILFGTGDIDMNKINSSLAKIAHRGPDHSQIELGDFFALAHARLSIIDLDNRSNQPFYSDDKRYIIAFNGEIYNYLELKNSLKKNGEQFRTNSDTEVLLKLLIREGKNALPKLNGFFAFVFIDTLTKSGIIARDHIGVKPLCYSINENRIVFGSYVNSVKCLVDDANLDIDAIGQYLQYSYIPGSRTVYKEIKKLNPGHFIELSDNRIQAPKKWYIPDDIPSIKESLFEVLNDSVVERLVADVKLGSFLSGGVDSSIIAALAIKHKPALETFSIGFEDAIYDESAFAKIVAKHIGSKHHSIKISDNELLSNVEFFVESIDEPFADSSALAVMSLCKYTAESVKVALSGDGADELFAGYNKHKALLRSIQPSSKDKLAGVVGKIVPQGTRSSEIGNTFRRLKKWSKGMNLSPLDRYILWASFMEQSTVKSLLNKEYKPYDFGVDPKNSMHDFLKLDQALVLPNDMLTKVDRMSMLNGVEVRVPFLSKKVIKKAHSYSTEELINNSQGKIILQKEFGNLLPKEIFERKKHGFEVPLKKWIKGPMKEFVNEFTSSDILNRHGLIDSVQANRIVSKLNHNQAGDAAMQIWSIALLHAWLEKN